MSRDKIIVRTSIIGIIANLFLAGFKAAVGAVSGSIAVVLDAVNNLSDALSSVITIIGTKLAGRQPDKKHPFGHERIEYLSAAIISLIILYAGITSLVESVKKIIHPELPDYSTVSLIIIAVAVGVKILLGRYVKKTGEQVNSQSLVASGSDAMFDAVISASTLLAALIFVLTHVSLEAWLGIIISAVIIKSGIEMLRETISQILGQRVDSDLSKGIKKTVCETDGVLGAYDLILNDYGPDTYLGSVHIEVPDDFTAKRIDRMTREIQNRVMEEHHVILTTVGVYAVNPKDSPEGKMQEDIRRAVMSYDHVLQMHGFYVNEETKVMTLDVIIDFLEKDKKALYESILKMIEEMYPGYDIHITMDRDISD